MDSSIPGIIWMPTTNHFDGRGGHAPRWLILHGTAGGTSAIAVANFLKGTEGTDEPASTHYIIGVNGEIVQMVKEADGAYGNGIIDGVPMAGLGFRTASDGVHRDPWWGQNGVNPNLTTISVEHCKPSTNNSDELTPAQAASSFKLTADICKRHNIPMRFADASGGITGHFSLQPKGRQRCPGPYPWEALWNYLKVNVTKGKGDDMPLSITDPFAAKHFKETSPTNWRCTTTGIDVHDAILAYWRRTMGAFRLPRTVELYGIAGGSFQVFEGGVIVYDPQGKLDNPGLGPVYAMHLDKDTPGLRKLLELAGIQIAAPSQPTATIQSIRNAVATLQAVDAGIKNALADLEPLIKSS